MKHTPFLLLAGAAAILIAFSGCGGGSEALGSGREAAASGAPGGSESPGGRQLPAVPVQAVTVSAGDLVTRNTTAGTVVPEVQSQVAAQTAGVVESIVARAGDWVTAGQTVVRLDDSQSRLQVRNAEAALESAKINLTVGRDTTRQANPRLQAQLQAAQSALDAAQRNYDSQKALFDLGGTSASQLDTAKSQLDQAKASLQEARFALSQNSNATTQNLAQLELAVDQAENQLEAARIALRNTAIKAPFDGQIAAVNVNPGMYVGQSTPIFLLVSASREVDFNVPPSDAPILNAGVTVQFSYGGRTYPVIIDNAPSAPINGVIPMNARFPENADLPFGTVGSVSYSLTLAHGVLVPLSAVQTTVDSTFVFTVENGKAARHTVEITDQAGAVAAVTGIEAGARVITSPPPGLIENGAVRIAGESGTRENLGSGAGGEARGEGGAP